jgi:hypothetical protein
MPPQVRRLQLPSWPRGLAFWALRVAGAVLVLLHFLLLVRRFADATIGEPAVLLKWLGGVAILASAEALRRRGGVPWKGRAGLAFTLVILLLHMGGAAPATSTLPETLFVVPSGLILAAAFAWTFVLAFSASGDATPRSAPAGRRCAEPPHVTVTRGFRRIFASRPPPRLA